jgi:site-specific DNA-methyltransferase (adenine-specific)
MRIEQIGNATLYLGDCMDILPTLDKVDAVITDPPYDNKTHEGHLSKVADRQELGFEQLFNFSGFVNACVDLSHRWVVMTCATTHALESCNRDDFVRLGVWIKPNGAPQFTGDRPGTGWEAVAIFHRNGKKRWNGGGHHAVWQYNIESGQHPTQKPIQLFSKFIEQFTDVSETILDPFMGSGTTGVAAIQLGRKFIGIEREPKYFEIACKRIEQAVAQGQLFEPEPSKPIQESMF